MEKRDKFEKLADKYGINLEKLKQEQIGLAKNLKMGDERDYSSVTKIGGIYASFFKNNIVSGVVVFSEKEVIGQEYFRDKAGFPYIPGFRSYREIPSMVQALNKLEEKPEVMLINGHGILHPRGIGMASHFSLSTGIPTIGIADSLLVGEIKGKDVLLDGGVKGRVVNTKQGAKPLLISPGNLISLETAVKIVKENVTKPHKMPEPLRIAKRYSKKVVKELFKD